jgi:hypothetical protein
MKLQALGTFLWLPDVSVMFSIARLDSACCALADISPILIGRIPVAAEEQAWQILWRWPPSLLLD